MDRFIRRSLTIALLLTACGRASPAASATASDGATGHASESHSSTSGEVESSSTTEAGSSSTSAAPCATDDECGTTEICGASACESLCGLTEELVIPITAPKIALVIETSSSMLLADVDHDSDLNTPPITRWRLLREGLLGPMGESDIIAHWSALRVTSIDASQGYNPEACAVDPAPEIPLEDALSIDELVASLPPADADAALLRGARPLRAALEAAYDHLLEEADGTPEAVYLFTTGAANCAANAEGLHALLEVADDGVVDLVADALAEGITTIVVGISLDAEPAPDAVDMEPDGVSTAEFVGQIALAGGYPNDDPDRPYYPLDRLADGPPLVDMLFDSGGTPGFELSHPVPLEMTLEVSLDGVVQPELPGDASCSESDGWVFNLSRDAIWLCGATGALVKESAEGLITYVCD